MFVWIRSVFNVTRSEENMFLFMLLFPKRVFRFSFLLKRH